MSLRFKKIILVEFTGLTLGNETIQVSSIQLNKTLPAHCIMHLWAQAKSLSTTNSFQGMYAPRMTYQVLFMTH